MLIDIYTHIFPKGYFNYLLNDSQGLGQSGGATEVGEVGGRSRRAVPRNGRTWRLPTNHQPAASSVGGDRRRPEAARLASMANDGLSELCAKYPDRFPAFVATVSLLNVESAVAEAERAITQLGAKGIQIYTNILGRALDDPEFDPIFRSWLSMTCLSGFTRRALPQWLIMRPSRDLASRCGGASVGRMKRRSPWRGWSSPVYSTAIPN